MQILSLNFLLYTICGLWRPIEWSSNCSKLLYSMYSFLVTYLMMFLMLTQFMDIIFVVDNIEDFATNFFMFMSVVSAICKIFTAIARRGQIINLIQILQDKPCKACNEEEIDIQIKFDRSIRLYSISYLILATFSCTGGTISALLAISQGQLPFRVWVPYDYTSPFLFWFTSLQEMLAVMVGTIINISTETLILGFCLQTCAQIEILKYRLQNMIKPDEEPEEERTLVNLLNSTSKRTSLLSEHVSHHLCIIRFAKMINETFSQVFFVQFYASILVLCSSVYYLSSHMTVADFGTWVIYTFCMFVQILVYCWAGNELILKSTSLNEAVYQMNWMLMTISEQKDLLMIMKRSIRPIKFTSSFLVTLSLDSYGNLLKASYSAFNLLQQS